MVAIGKTVNGRLWPKVRAGRNDPDGNCPSISETDAPNFYGTRLVSPVMPVENEVVETL